MQIIDKIRDQGGKNDSVRIFSPWFVAESDKLTYGTNKFNMEPEMVVVSRPRRGSKIYTGR